MLEFNVAAMTCGHCVRAVTEAVHEIDPQAQVNVDLPTHKVQVQTRLASEQVAAALTEAGYPPG